MTYLLFDSLNDASGLRQGVEIGTPVAENELVGYNIRDGGMMLEVGVSSGAVGFMMAKNYSAKYPKRDAESVLCGHERYDDEIPSFSFSNQRPCDIEKGVYWVGLDRRDPAA